MPEKPPLSTDVAEIIRRKKSQYCRFADGCEWHRFDGIMLPSFTFEAVETDGTAIMQGGVRYRWESREAWVAQFSEAFKATQTMRLVDPGDLERVSEDEVRAVFGVIWHAGTRDTEAGVHSTGGGALLRDLEAGRRGLVHGELFDEEVVLEGPGGLRRLLE